MKDLYIRDANLICAKSVCRKEEFMESKKYSLLFPNGDFKYKKISDTAMHDLGFDQICKKLSPKESEQNYIMKVMSQMYAEPEAAEYRCDIFEDVLGSRELRDNLMKVLDRISFLKDYGSFKREYDENSGMWDLMHRLDEINDYIQCVDFLHECLEGKNIHSKGFTGLKEYVEKIYSDNGFGELKKDISQLNFDTSELKSITVGINLNNRFEAEGIGLISINSKYFTRPGVLGNFYEHIASKDRINDNTEWKKDYKFHPFSTEKKDLIKSAVNALQADPSLIDYNPVGISGVPDGDGARELTRYTDRVVNGMLSGLVKKTKAVLNKYVSITITDMTDLIPELMYYIRWAEYIENLGSKGAVFTKTVINKIENGDGSKFDYCMKARGVYNIKLVAFDTEETGNIVKNDLDFDEEHRVYILTGANRGGKTTITQTIGQLFVLAQGGIYIPGDGFEFTPVDCIYTHFPADEDKTLDLGRLGEECKRFKEIFESAESRSLMLLNETFSTTSFEEGYYIAKDSVRAILHKGIRTIYNTHMHKLAFDIDDMNGENISGKAYSLIVHNEDSKRSYKVEIAPPAGKSYASDIAKKYGVTYDMLVKET